MQFQLKKDLLAEISCRWGLEFVRRREDLPLAGSPERTSWRCVLETGDSRLYVLEKIASRVYGRKRSIALVLQQLNTYGLNCIVPYLPDIQGECIPLIAHGLWQLSPFLPGIDLDRPAYVMDGWRGDAAAEFLIQIYGICSQYSLNVSCSPFLLTTYIRNLFALLSRENSETAACFLPFKEHLERHLFPNIDRFPIRFCHGDYHPLNIIWGERTIRAVIDWEFCGLKPEIYDLANLVGCLGMEDPQSLAGPLVRHLIGRLKKSGIFSTESWKALPDFILAVRFAWLSEWMRKNDRPMIQLEEDYMALLLENRAALKQIGMDGY